MNADGLAVHLLHDGIIPRFHPVRPARLETSPNVRVELRKFWPYTKLAKATTTATTQRVRDVAIFARGDGRSA
jgi:hypothetical protein